MGVLESAAVGLGEPGGVAEEVVPAGFDVDVLGAEGPGGELALFAGGDVDDAGLGVEAAEREGEGPCDDEVAEGGLVEDVRGRRTRFEQLS